MQTIASPVSSQKKYIPQLDGIRGLAILLVVTFHYFGFIKIFSFGWTGVDLFFVLSGYLITSRLYDLKKEKNYFSKFYTNRALRILPVYYLTLILFYTAINLFVKSENVGAFNFYNRNWWSFLLFFQNWTFIKEMPAAKHLQHFWSLAVEEQFYLIWPMFIFLFIDKKWLNHLIILLLIIIMFARSLIYVRYPAFEDYPKYFYNTFCRMDSFMIGGCFFLFQDKKIITLFAKYFFIPLIIIAAGIYFTNTKQNNPFTSTVGYTILAVFFAGFLNYCIINPGSIIGKCFKAKWLRFMGKVSYGFYIYHWLVLLVLQPKLIVWLNRLFFNKEEIILWLSLILCILFSLLLSVISYFYFESYFLKLKK